jgi:hypothetical protein
MIQAPCTGKRWIIELIKKLWAVAWDQWEHLNEMLHERKNLIAIHETEKSNQDIAWAYQEFKPLLAITDQHFFNQPLTWLLTRSKRAKEARLKQVTVAKEREIQHQQQRSGLTHMQQHMRQWLSLAR